MNKLLTGTLVLSGLTNIALLSDLSRVEKKTDAVLEKINRTHLIAMLYVLQGKENQNLINKKIKEDKHMKNIGSKFSNRTKVIGGMTILLGIGTVVSMVKDAKEVNALDADVELLDGDVTEVIDDAIEGIGDAAVEIVNI